MGGMDRYRPAEDRFTWAEVIGDRATYEPVAGEVLVRVHEPGRENGRGIAEHCRIGPPGAQVACLGDFDDRVAGDRDGTISNDLPPRVHRDHVVSDHD